MLAGDADGAAVHAEHLLRERALSAYYDDVVLPGLGMAAHDVVRGVLDPARLPDMHAAVLELVEALEDHEDDTPEGHDDGAVAPPAAERDLPNPLPPEGAAPPQEARTGAWRNETPMLCLAGRNAIDESAAAVLAQLLGKHGLGARVLPCDAASRTRIGELDLSDTAMVILSYFESTGSPSHLRFVLRRLRQKLPHGTIAVGLWPSGETMAREEELRRTLGADAVVSTLKEAVDLAIARCSESAADRGG
jgi:hypothetical protein